MPSNERNPERFSGGVLSLKSTGSSSLLPSSFTHLWTVETDTFTRWSSLRS
ncbi:MAG: hypothetical protein ACTSXH_14095 [Promethearchaeota archaeon]